MKEKFIILTFLLFFTEIGLAQEVVETKYLAGTWLHSVEEQTDGVFVFRPEGYELPKVRGREKMKFTEDFKYVFYQIAPEDGFLKLPGEFQLDGINNILIVTYQKYENTIKRKYKIVKLNHSILKLKLIN